MTVAGGSLSKRIVTPIFAARCFAIAIEAVRIATKYHRLVRDFLTANDIADYQLIDSQGATEGTVKNLTAEAIADINDRNQLIATASEEQAHVARSVDQNLIGFSDVASWA